MVLLGSDKIPSLAVLRLRLALQLRPVFASAPPSFAGKLKEPGEEVPNKDSPQNLLM